MARVSFSVEHARQLRFVRDAGFVGNGRGVFYTVAEIDGESRETHSLWLVEDDARSVRRVGEELVNVRVPAPSPGGQVIAVLADVEGGQQIWLVPMDGGAPRQLTELPQGISGRPVWSPGGDSIAFTAGPPKRDPSLPYRVDRATYRFDGLGYLDDVVQDIFVVDVASASVRQLTSDRFMNSDPRWSPDGTSLLYRVSFDPDRAWTFLPELHSLVVQTGESRVLVADWGGVFRAEWCPDGERVAFVGCSGGARHPFVQKSDLWTMLLTTFEPECRTASVPGGARPRIQADLPVYEELATPRIYVIDDVAYVGGQEGGDAVIYRVALSGPEAVERVAGANGSAYLVDVDATSGPLYLATSFTEPPELVLGSRRITALNDELLSGVTPPEVRKLEVTASDGLTSNAWALTPSGEQGPWPTILYIHGGPYGAFGSTYMIDFQLLTGAGFAVVFHNFRGSAGYGREFSERIVGDWGRAGSLDHHATLDEAIRVGVADPERLGVCGYSHGGFATCWLVGTSERFKAAVAENPATSWVSSFGDADSEWWIPLELGGTPDELPDAYRELSPLTYARNCRTPLLFVISEADLRCHPVESEQYYRVLKSNDVPTEMLRLPNTSHVGTWNGPVAARTAQNEALVDWFARYLKPRVSAAQSGS